MSGMDHAAAHERIEDLILEPARLDGLVTSPAPEDVALREHLEACPACRADLDGWRRVQRTLAGALPPTAEAAMRVEPVELPPSLRARVLAAVRSADGPGVPIEIERHRRRRPLALAGMAAAAALVVVLGAGALVLDQATRRAAADAEARALATLVAAVDGVLATDHKIVELRRPDGTAVGSISWSRHDWVVLTSGLTAPPQGRRYLCWLEDGDGSVSVGEMEFVGGTAYWVATLDDWQTWEIGPTTQFVVSLEAGDPSSRTGEVVLSADLGA